MARKTKAEAEATREGILDAAELCFLEDGVFRTTLERIAARAGYTRGAVYWHFKNKQEVLEVVIDRLELPIVAGLEQLGLAQHNWPMRALRVFFKRAFNEFSRNTHARNAIEIILLRCELVEETRSILLRQQQSMVVGLAHVTKAFVRARQLKQLQEHLEPATCALAVHCLAYGVLREWLLNPKMSHLPRQGMAVLDAVLAGFVVEGAWKGGDGTRAAPAARRAVARGKP